MSVYDFHTSESGLVLYSCYILKDEGALQISWMNSPSWGDRGWGKAWGGSSVQAIASRGSVNSIGDGIGPPYSHNPGLFKCIMSGTCLDERCLDLCVWFGVILIQHIWKSVESSMPEWEAEQPQHGIQKSSSLTTCPPFKSLAECHKEDRVTVIGLQQISEDIFSVKTTSKHLIESGHFLPWLSVL